jgi:NAD(P)-dependent dehydrogenase (short-subunit alcohol dehydrogenase family)
VSRLHKTLRVMPSGIGKPQVAYSTTKAAILSFTRTTAVIYADKGVRLNTVVPGPINTPLVKMLADKSLEETMRVIGRFEIIRYQWARWGPHGTLRMQLSFWPVTKLHT